MLLCISTNLHFVDIQIKKLWSVYISVIVLILDSIFQSIGCILIDLFVQDFDRATVLNFSSMIFNIVVLILLRFLQKIIKIKSGTA